MIQRLLALLCTALLAFSAVAVVTATYFLLYLLTQMVAWPICATQF